MDIKALSDYSTPTTISGLLQAARNAAPYKAHQPPGFAEPLRFEPVEPVAVGSISLGSTWVTPAQAFDTTGIAYSGPPPDRQNEKLTLASSVLANSRCAQAGANLVIGNRAPEGIDVASAQPILYQRPALMRVVKAAPIHKLTDNQIPAPPDAWPVDSFEASIGDAPTYLARVKITRRQLKMLPADGLVEYELLKSFSLALGNAVDRSILDLIGLVDGLNTFTFGQAAAQNLSIDELRAMVGTSGTGAAIRQDGTFAVSGIPADLTSVIAGTIIGAFNRSFALVSDRLTIIIKRTSTEGDMEAFLYADIVPAIPSVGMFWKAA